MGGEGGGHLLLSKNILVYGWSIFQARSQKVSCNGKSLVKGYYYSFQRIQKKLNLSLSWEVKLAAYVTLPIISPFLFIEEGNDSVRYGIAMSDCSICSFFVI